MQKRICSVCGYVFDESKEGLFEDLPTDWVCPLCKADKSVFVSETQEKQEVDLSLLDTVEEKLSAFQISAVCSNLAKGCEKQYLMEEAELFSQLASYFKESSRVMTEQKMSILQTMINRDLNELFPLVESIASKHHDRGALRAYTWSLKVTTILKSLLEQYENVNAQSFDSTGVYVCAICGFIYVGNDLPALCPICKVPNYKFEEVKGE